MKTKIISRFPPNYSIFLMQIAKKKPEPKISKSLRAIVHFTAETAAQRSQLGE